MSQQTDLIKRHASIFTVFHSLCSALVAIPLRISCATAAPSVERLWSIQQLPAVVRVQPP